jgi:hypothetical protein
MVEYFTIFHRQLNAGICWSLDAAPFLSSEICMAALFFPVSAKHAKHASRSIQIELIKEDYCKQLIHREVKRT